MKADENLGPLKIIYDRIGSNSLGSTCDRPARSLCHQAAHDLQHFP
jgi:hypothetical protein